MDADERRALEDELAAALAELSDDDLDPENEEDSRILLQAPRQQDAIASGQGMVRAQEYVRLDLDQLLLQVVKESDAQSTSDGSAPIAAPSSTWGLLLATVVKCDQEFFQFIKHDLDELQTTILAPPVSSIETSEVGSSFSCTWTDPVDLQEAKESTAAVPAQSSFGAEERDDPAAVVRADPESANARSSIPQTAPASVSTMHALSTNSAAHGCSSITSASEDALEDEEPTDVTPASEQSTFPRCESVAPPQEQRSGERAPQCPRETADPSLAQETKRQMQWIHEQHVEWQRILAKAQEQRQREQQQIARQMQALEQQWVQHEQEQQRQQEMQQQAKERRAMQQEELSLRAHHAAVKQGDERIRMAHEEQVSQSYHDFLQLEQQNQQLELAAMAFEEAREWRRIRAEFDKQRNERLMEEKCVLRRRFNGVLFQLVAIHETKVVEMHRREQEIRKRELREATHMRSEELYQRRVLAQIRALEEEQRRQRERNAMVKEDAFAQALALAAQQAVTRERVAMEHEDCMASEMRASEQRILQDRNRLGMAKEEELSRRVQVDEFQQLHLQLQRHETCKRILVHRVRIAYLGIALQQWKSVADQFNDAAKRVQRVYRAWRHSKHSCFEEERAFSAAAMVVQSTFRGFSIRRKFTNALEMARLSPPELEDGWEDPVLPATRQCHHPRSPDCEYVSGSSPSDREDSGDEEGDGDEEQEPGNDDLDERDEDLRQCHKGTYQYSPTAFVAHPNGNNDSNAISTATTPPYQAQQQAGPTAQPQSVNLAASLWDKMRKMKQKQRHAAEERVREQDPTYRLQKLMHKSAKKQQQPSKVPPTNNSNGAPSTAPSGPLISWGSTNGSGEKKKPKVKLPSLVERLRKKTEAAR